MKALGLLKEKLFKLFTSFDGVWISPKELNEATKKIFKESSNDRLAEIEEYRIKKVMYENILSLIDIETKKQVLSEASSYELKIFSKTIRDIILNNYISNIDTIKETSK